VPVEKIYPFAFAYRTKDLLQSKPNWEAVEILAMELLKQKTVGAKRVREIIAEQRF
jgi:hypothetical protein